MFRAIVVVALSLAGSVAPTCNSIPNNPVTAQDPANYRETCINALSQQVRMEFEASLQYLLMAARFSQDTYHLPGVANLFWNHADEEREHAKAFINYLRMRGSLDNNFFQGNPIKPILGKNTWDSVAEALRDALTMEKAVSKSMKNMIDLCSQGTKEIIDQTESQKKLGQGGEDDPHAADWLTGTWLEEQLNGQRHLAGLINTLEAFSRDHDEMAEWLFDKEL